MNKNIIYIGTAVIVGLLAGFLLFGGDSKMTDNNRHPLCNLNREIVLFAEWI